MRGVMTGAATGIVVSDDETETFNNETLTGYQKTESVTNPAGTTFSNPYQFESSVLQFLMFLAS